MMVPVSVCCLYHSSPIAFSPFRSCRRWIPSFCQLGSMLGLRQGTAPSRLCLSSSIGIPLSVYREKDLSACTPCTWARVGSYLVGVLVVPLLPGGSSQESIELTMSYKSPKRPSMRRLLLHRTKDEAGRVREPKGQLTGKRDLHWHPPVK